MTSKMSPNRLSATEVRLPPIACYSDHAEDIRTKGSCDYCGGRS